MLLFDEKNSDPRFRSRIVNTVGHELAHQWVCAPCLVTDGLRLTPHPAVVRKPSNDGMVSTVRLLPLWAGSIHLAFYRPSRRCL